MVLQTVAKENFEFLHWEAVRNERNFPQKPQYFLNQKDLWTGLKGF